MKFKVYILVIAIAGFFAGSANAVPIADITYIESDLGGGSWKYDYVFANNSDTNNNLYDVLFAFENASALIAFSAPTGLGWDSFSGLGDFTSLDPSFDIVPNGSLDGFSLTFNYRAGDLPFVATFTNPDFSYDPLSFSGISANSNSTTPIPEPGTMVLFGSGLAGLIGYGRMRRKR